MSKVKILFLAADPSDLARLRLGEELREIREKLQLSRERDSFALESRESVRPKDITQAIFDVDPQIVHFSGHGSPQGELYFEDVLGRAQPVSPEAIAGLFELVSDQVSCVILNACFSETQAAAIADHIPIVIGMSDEIGDRAAIIFAAGFYKALGAGHSFENAYKFACLEIQLENISQNLVPTLYKKLAIDPTSPVSQKIIPAFSNVESMALTPQQLCERGLIKQNLNDFDLACDDYSEAIRLNPNHLEAYYLRAKLTTERRYWDCVVPDCDRYLAMSNSDSAEIYCWRAYANSNMGKVHGILEDFDKAITVNSEYHWIFYFRAKHRIKHQEYNTALTDLNLAILICQTEHIFYVDRAFCHHVLNNLNQSLVDYNSAISLNPDEIELYKYRADIKYWLKDKEGALADMEYVISGVPRAENYIKRANLRGGFNELEGALQDYSKAINFVET
jgi:tetratricopeptide (TPR) repeat protein